MMYDMLNMSCPVSVYFRSIFGLFSVYFQSIFGLFSVYFRSIFSLFSVYFQSIFSPFFATFGAYVHRSNYVRLCVYLQVSIANNGWAVVAPDIESAVRLANLAAPEHLEV